MKNTVKRFFAFLIDWMIIVFIGSFLITLGPNFDIKYFFYPSIDMISLYGVVLSIDIWAFFPLFKDCVFNCASFGKVLLGLKVVDSKTLKKPSVVKLIIRNITFYFPFVDVIVWLVTHGKTLGDIISDTVVLSAKNCNMD